MYKKRDTLKSTQSELVVEFIDYNLDDRLLFIDKVVEVSNQEPTIWHIGVINKTFFLESFIYSKKKIILNYTR